MKTEISNFFVLVVIFLLGWFLVFCFLFRKQKTENFLEFKSDQKMTTNTRKSTKKHPESHLGLFSVDLTLSKKKLCRFLPVSACRRSSVLFFCCLPGSIRVERPKSLPGRPLKEKNRPLGACLPGLMREFPSRKPLFSLGNRLIFLACCLPVRP